MNKRQQHGWMSQPPSGQDTLKEAALPPFVSACWTSHLQAHLCSHSLTLSCLLPGWGTHSCRSPQTGTNLPHPRSRSWRRWARPKANIRFPDTGLCAEKDGPHPPRPAGPTEPQLHPALQPPQTSSSLKTNCLPILSAELFHIPFFKSHPLHCVCICTMLSGPVLLGKQAPRGSTHLPVPLLLAPGRSSSVCRSCHLRRLPEAQTYTQLSWAGAPVTPDQHSLCSPLPSLLGPLRP